MENNIILKTMNVGNIKDDYFFNIPSYQRGYRWGKNEVTRLLDDIYENGNKNYFLQPIVVKQVDEKKYDLIDGQQRLTTLFLIFKYLLKNDKSRFSLEYITRPNSGIFLQNIGKDEKVDEDKHILNADFYHIYNAYKTIKEWFEVAENRRDIRKYLLEEDNNNNAVKVIWYQIPSDSENETYNPISLFTRLNIGKIPLTNAELVKAMFLSRKNELSGSIRKEISLQWDLIEKALHKESLWYFLTNSTSSSYQTRIDFILNIIANKKEKDREEYSTFFYFDDKRKKNEDIYYIWKNIFHTFLHLKGWYDDHTLYHKIGYLIASNTLTLSKIYNESMGNEEAKPKDKIQFENYLDDKIKASVKFENEIMDLKYNENNKLIHNILLLFNIESVRTSAAKSSRFPFNNFKSLSSNNSHWSLEHIHAQKSERMNTDQQWKAWLKFHIQPLKAIGSDEDLIKEIEEITSAGKKITENTFNSYHEKIAAIMNKGFEQEDLHTIANLALLDTGSNAALNNSAFAAKRNKIIDMDKGGQYLPYCTRMVFLKYYTPSENNQLHFWTKDDGEAYVGAILTTLKQYLNSNAKETI